MDREATDLENGKAAAEVEQRRTERWLLPDNFLRTKRVFYNSETDQLDRTALRYFAPSSAQLFDTAYSTLVLQHRLYAALSERWAEQHPLLDHEVHLTRVQQLFREFSNYSIELLHKIYVSTFRPDNQLGRVLIERRKNTTPDGHDADGGSGDIRANAISRRTFDALRETLERERKEAARLHVENEQLFEELETLNEETIVLAEKSNTAIQNSDYIANNYLRYLIASKTVRRRILRNELADLLKFAGPSRTDSTSRSRERILSRTLIAALNEILKMNRILSNSTSSSSLLSSSSSSSSPSPSPSSSSPSGSAAVSPSSPSSSSSSSSSLLSALSLNPMSELDKKSRVELVVPKTIKLFGRHAESLMKLYNELYIQLTELEAKRAIDREKSRPR